MRDTFAKVVRSSQFYSALDPSEMSLISKPGESSNAFDFQASKSSIIIHITQSASPHVFLFPISLPIQTIMAPIIVLITGATEASARVSSSSISPNQTTRSLPPTATPTTQHPKLSPTCPRLKGPPFSSLRSMPRSPLTLPTL